MARELSLKLWRRRCETVETNALARRFDAPSLLRFALPNIAMMVFLSL